MESGGRKGVRALGFQKLRLRLIVKAREWHSKVIKAKFEDGGREEQMLLLLLFPSF